MTTIFTPPPSCLSTVTYDGTTFWQGGLLQTGDQDCYPPHFTDIFDSQYTPGICPHGWTSVGNPNGVGPITQPDGDLASKAFCCPSVSEIMVGIATSSLNTSILGLLSFLNGRRVSPERMRQSFRISLDKCIRYRYKS